MRNLWNISILVLSIVVLAACSSKKEEQTEAKANGESYPKKTIQIVVPWNPGGETDAITRMVAEDLEEELDQDIVIKNIAGGSGVVGAQEVLNANNDGYTLLAVHDSMALSELTGQADFGFADYEPISLLTSTYELIGTHPDNPWENMDDLINDAKEKPGEISYAASIGSTTQLLPALIQTDSDIELNIVGYDGTAERMKAVAGGDVHLSGVSVTAGKDYLEDERMKVLGYTGTERSPQLPDVPTLIEQGIDVSLATNIGLVAPKGTSDEIIKILNDALKKVANTEEFATQMEQLGSELNFKKSEDYINFIEKNEGNMKVSLEEAGLSDS